MKPTKLEQLQDLAQFIDHFHAETQSKEPKPKLTVTELRDGYFLLHRGEFELATGTAKRIARVLTNALHDCMFR